MDHQNNYVENSNTIAILQKNFDILAISLNVLHNFFDNLTRLFLYLCLAKF